jgi:hypothetical protein
MMSRDMLWTSFNVFNNPSINISLKMIKIDRNMSELRQILGRNIIVTLVHCLFLLCELFIDAGHE